MIRKIKNQILFILLSLSKWTEQSVLITKNGQYSPVYVTKLFGKTYYAMLHYNSNWNKYQTSVWVFDRQYFVQKAFMQHRLSDSLIHITVCSNQQ